MTDSNPPLFSRIFIAFGAFWQTVFNAQFAAGVARLQRDSGDVPPAAEPPRQTTMPDAALQLLALLQRNGRLIDFIEDQVSSYSDAEIGAAARVIHEGCRKTLRDHFTLEPIRNESEGSPVVLEKGFNASAVRLTGNVVGTAPFSGTLAHRGWRATRVELPQTTTGHDVTIIAPAEVAL